MKPNATHRRGDDKTLFCDATQSEFTAHRARTALWVTTAFNPV